MLLDPYETSSLNRLIALQFQCNSTEAKSLVKLFLCRSLKVGLRYELDNPNGTWSSNVTSKQPRSTSHGNSKVYRVFYSSESSSDSIIYILAILCIYFLLFSLLIYANWTTFNHKKYKTKRRLRKRKHQLDSESTNRADSDTLTKPLNSIICLAGGNIASSDSKHNYALTYSKCSTQEDQGPPKEPTVTTTATVLLNKHCKVDQI